MVSRDEFIAFAAETIGVPSERLSLETTYESIPEWDSMAQLRLVIETEKKYGVEIPFAEVVTVTSLWEFLRRINGGAMKKVVAVDLDNTLWNGVVGEDGLNGITPNDGLQRELKALKDRGVLLVVLSKNNEVDGLAGLDRQEILSREDFVAWRIDWNGKADNLVSIAEELNLGVDSFVFVDDNPAERIEMSVRLPDVTVTEFPPNLSAYFPERSLTEEDLHKTEEYRAEARRKDCLKNIDASQVWTALGIELEVHPLSKDEVPRVAQLSQKANQFNVRTNRYTEEDIIRIANEGLVVTAHARDRFGDQGLIAFVIVRGNEIVDWVMSCRVMGRGIEEKVEREIERLLELRGITELTASWSASGKNEPVRELYDRLGFTLMSATETKRCYCKRIR